MRHNMKEVLQWIAASIVGVIIVNCLCFLYERPVGWLDTPSGASLAVRRPDAFLVHGTEGYGFSRIDRNGFTNPDKELSDSYLLIMGASHTQGKELMPRKKYSVLVSDALSGGDGLLHTYNIACDGHFLPSLLQHFYYAVQDYPEAAGIVIEIYSTDYSPEELEVDFSHIQDRCNLSASELFEQMTIPQKTVKQYIKEAVPFLSLVKTKLETKVAAGDLSNADESVFEYDPNDYRQVLDATLTKLRECWDKPIVFVYHPLTELRPDGSLELVYSESWELFAQICAENQIDVIDMGDRFTHLYEQKHELPYGFSDTAPGSGHLNTVGHQLIADEIIRYWEEVQK